MTSIFRREVSSSVIPLCLTINLSILAVTKDISTPYNSLEIFKNLEILATVFPKHFVHHSIFLSVSF